MKISTFKIRNYLRNRFGLNKSCVSEIRPTSFPYVTGDLFRSLANYIVEDEESCLRISALDPSAISNKSRFIVFVSVGFIYNKKNQDFFLHQLENLKQTKKCNEWTVILHNGDKIPSVDFYKQLKNFFDYVYSVNLVVDEPGLTAIPIGLENLHFLRNGEYQFISHFISNQYFGASEKTNLIFSSFNVETNYEVRSKVLSSISKSRFACSIMKCSPAEYKTLLSKSFFAISPPGNGHDCHRTWEAIYLKTIPVVLKGSLSPALSKNLPILIVEDYDDFLKLDDSEMKRLYHEIIIRDNTSAFAKYWIDNILN